MTRDTTAALYVALGCGSVGVLAAWRDLAWGWAALGVALVMLGAVAGLSRAQRRKLAPLALAAGVLAVVGMAPIAARWV